MMGPQECTNLGPYTVCFGMKSIVFGTLEVQVNDDPLDLQSVHKKE